MKIKNKIAVLIFGAVPLILICGNESWAAVYIPEYKDTLDQAQAGVELINGKEDPAFDLFVADRGTYDSNVYRLSSGVDAAAVVGPNASKSDTINSPGVGMDGQWVFGRQIVNLELRVDDNLYAHNSDLNNVSTYDKFAWNWGLGGVLSGVVGADLLRALAGFVNTNVYTRNVYQRTEYFATARYELGPRWTIYGGLLDSLFTLADSSTQGNDSRQNTVDMGAEFATSPEDTMALDYRYTDARYINTILVNDSIFNPDYREDRIRFLIKHALTEKTSVDAEVGYLKRDYGDTVIGSFLGPVWRVSLGWQPTEKTQLVVATWRNLQAYLTDQTNYFRATGVSISPIWNASEKISMSLLISREDQTYIGSSQIEPIGPGRRDTVDVQQANLSYSPIHALTFNLSYRHEERQSNQPLLPYNDDLASIGVKFVFF